MLFQHTWIMDRQFITLWVNLIQLHICIHGPARPYLWALRGNLDNCLRDPGPDYDLEPIFESSTFYKTGELYWIETWFAFMTEESVRSSDLPVSVDDSVKTGEIVKDGLAEIGTSVGQNELRRFQNNILIWLAPAHMSISLAVVDRPEYHLRGLLLGCVFKK